MTPVKTLVNSAFALLQYFIHVFLILTVCRQLHDCLCTVLGI
uniref:Uncharacterized protein n=1 Tax=Siphoviridae sp. ct87j35 TaxID=2825356 RepID=A0A8S5V4V3_9CAUD|nr:MAG TPA: hypothetical protein [Siphoviridae sp. ct87j35]